MTAETWKYRKGWGVEIPYVQTKEVVTRIKNDDGTEMVSIKVTFEPPKQDL